MCVYCIIGGMGNEQTYQVIRISRKTQRIFGTPTYFRPRRNYLTHFPHSYAYSLHARFLQEIDNKCIALSGYAFYLVSL